MDKDGSYIPWVLLDQSGDSESSLCSEPIPTWDLPQEIFDEQKQETIVVMTKRIETDKKSAIAVVNPPSDNEAIAKSVPSKPSPSKPTKPPLFIKRAIIEKEKEDVANASYSTEISRYLKCTKNIKETKAKTRKLVGHGGSKSKSLNPIAKPYKKCQYQDYYYDKSGGHDDDFKYQHPKQQSKPRPRPKQKQNYKCYRTYINKENALNKSEVDSSGLRKPSRHGQRNDNRRRQRFANRATHSQHQRHYYNNYQDVNSYAIYGY